MCGRKHLLIFVFGLRSAEPNGLQPAVHLVWLFSHTGTYPRAASFQQLANGCLLPTSSFLPFPSLSDSPVPYILIRS